MDRTGQTDLAELLEDNPLLTPVVAWLRRHGAEPATVIAEALRDLRQRGAYLNRARRTRYTRRPVLGTFFVLWATKHHGKLAQPNHLQRELVPADELRDFEAAVIALGDEATFRRVMPRMVRQRQNRPQHPDWGNAEQFTCHVAEKAAEFADIFLDNFVLDRPRPGRAAVAYLETVSVSRYLQRVTREARNRSGLIAYLNGRNKLDERTRLAAKLVEMPALLTYQETQVLRDRYGLTGSFTLRRRIRDVAEQLGYPSPAVLSRKLYRVRTWSKSGRLPRSVPEEWEDRNG